MDEIKLVRKSKKGNNLAFSTLIKTYEKDLYKVAMSIKDISESLNIPQGTIKSRLSRARKKLKEILSINEEVL